jgi:hypothetical protein
MAVSYFELFDFFLLSCFLLKAGNCLEDTAIILLNTKITRPAVLRWISASVSLLREFVFSGEVRE